MFSRLGTIILLIVWIGQVGSVAPTIGVEGNESRYTARMQMEDWRAWVACQVRRLVLKQGGGRRRRRRRGKRRRRRRAVVWYRLKPAIEELVEEKMERETSVLVETKARGEGINDFRLPMQVVVVTPDYSQTVCPDCGSASKCKRSYYNHPQDIDLERPTILQVYREVRECCNENCEWRGAPELDFVEKSGRFTKRAKQKAIAAVSEDGMPLTRVPQRMWRDFHVRVSKSTVHKWVHAEAEADLGENEYTQWVVARFSGVVGIDEVHLYDENGNKQYLIVAVDPINDRTILFDLIDSRDSDAIKDFLRQLEEMGIDPLVIITDMWKAYHSAILDVFQEAEQQLCVFHVIQAVMKHTNKAMLTYRRELPQETEAQKEIRKELWHYRYLLLKANHKLSDQQRQQLDEILETHIDTVIPKAYKCKEAILTLFRESEDKDDARTRRDTILKEFDDVPELKKVLNVIRGDDFERMIVYLDYENLDKTNNNAERGNRTYQKGEKVRYRARKTHTRLDYVRLQARRRNHRSAGRDDHLRRKKKGRKTFARRVDAVVEREARRLTA